MRRRREPPAPRAGRSERRSGATGVRSHGRTRATAWRALVLLASLALAPAASAQYDVGARALERGEFAEAWMTLRPLARKGHAMAQNDVGVMYALGLGVPASMEEAARWLTLAAEQGVAESQARLGWVDF